MIITDIIPVNKQKFRITTDEQLSFVLYKAELSRYQLEKGSQLGEDNWTEIQDVLIKRAKLRAMHLLTKMDYTEAELYQKLMQGGYTEKAVACAMEYVKSFHYLNDKHYVTKYMERANMNKSRRQKEFELERKGVSKELIKQWKEETDEQETDETPLIRKLLEKRCRNPQEADDKEKMKHYGYLVRKGFASCDIMQVFEEYFERFS